VNGLPRPLPSRATLEAAMLPHGLRVCGAWIPTDADLLPSLPGGRAAAVVWMVGQIGSQSWNAFATSPIFSDGQAHPMDRWSKSIAEPLARNWGGLALFPSDGPPYLPFARWSARAESLQSSPIKLQIHPDYGLWHACRFALALPTLKSEDASEAARVAHLPAADLCRRCEGQPCLRACPVQAFSETGYDVPRCAAHLHAPQGAACMSEGCLARRACPVGTPYRYAPAHAAFHMASFAGNH